MSLADNKKVVEKFFKALREGDVKSVDKLTHEEFAFRAGAGPNFINKETFMKYIGTVLTSFPDHTNIMDDIIAEGDKVAVRMTSTGTFKGEWQGHKPTGKYFSIQEYFFLRIKDGRVADYWGIKDALGQYLQLGIKPPDKMQMPK